MPNTSRLGSEGPIHSDVSSWMSLLKGFAILEIVAFHFFGDHGAAALRNAVQDGGSTGGALLWAESMFLQATRVGSQGIHVFFFLSGFGLAASNGMGRLDRRAFILKRMDRLYPAYFVAVLLCTGIVFLATARSPDVGAAVDFLAAVALVQNYSVSTINAINGNWWFVGALVPMYFVHMFFAETIRANPARATAFAFAVSFSYKLLVLILGMNGMVAFDAGALNPFTAFFLNYVWEFVAGAAVCSAWRAGRLDRILAVPVMLPLFVGLLFECAGVFLGFSKSGRIFNDDFFAVAQILLLSAAFLGLRNAMSLKAPLVRLLVRLGGMSYGLYLVHHPISRLLGDGVLAGAGVIALIPVFVVYFVVCLLVGNLVESAGKAIFQRHLLPVRQRS